MDLLNELLANRTTTRTPKPGIPLSELTESEQEQEPKRIRVIPGGMGLTNLAYLLTDPAVETIPGLDFDYVNSDESFERFMHHMLTNEPKPVDMIVAGSRGAELIARIAPFTNCTILLFGPVYLNRIVPSSNNKIVIVHGVHDTNERIESVRAYTERHQPHVTLIEVNNRGHDLSLDARHIRNIVDFSLNRSNRPSV